ncbi:MAG: ABC transporter ATP-binding protein [Candidatus Cloacimonetes bacterium]|jgi:ABC-type bacteriocin/lantibiotic exporter with double-glycine peptidase domain|nr:ABC transporter ATP-binding protein [Candidatus Cloacimonadota bacterium]
MKKDELGLIYGLLRKYFYRYRKKILLAFCIMLAVSVVSMGMPYISRYIIDKAIPSNKTGLLVAAAALYFILIVLTTILSYYQEFILARLNFLVMITMRKDLVKRVHNMPLQEYYHQSGSYIFNRINNDTVMVLETFMSSAVRIVNEVVMIAVGAVFIAMLNVYLTFAVVLLLFINALISQRWGAILAKLQAQILEHYTIHNSRLQESVSATFLVKIYDLQYRFATRLFSSFKQYYEVYVKFVLKTYRQYTYTLSIQEFCRSLIYVGGGYAIMTGKFTIGGLFAYLALFQLINSPINRLVMNLVNFHKNVPLFMRLHEYLNLESECLRHNGAGISIAREIEFRGVSFAYQMESPIIQDFSYTIKPGFIYLVSGNSGTGKTTLAMLLMGIYLPQKGQIVIDGIELNKEHIYSMRKQSSYVEQEPLMIDDSIYENILLGNPSATEEDVCRVAELANVFEFVNKLPDKYRTLLGAKGINLSTGQKQRIAIARALLKNPRVMILDEPTSNIDSISEAMIHNTIRSLPKDMFIIMISHKNETRQIADEVISIQG